MTQIKRVSIITLMLSFVLITSSCDINKKINVDENTINENLSNENSTTIYGDELHKLEGSIKTLSKYQLPNTGEEFSGFKVNAIYDYESRNAKVVIFNHEKSDAKAILISNDDSDKMAAIGFNTLAYDDKGIPHVFEHACLGGSDKYDSAKLFDEAVNKTYNTYMNAFTMQHATVYPVSSLSDKQLFELYRFYLSGVFNPNVLSDEKNIEREAYRYTLYDKVDDIKLNGIVYSEMSGIEGSILSASYNNSLKTMFNDSFMGANTGGNTDEIPNIKIEDLKEFHEKYYHPSNMILMLYGDIDYKKYLDYIDKEYLNKYERKDILKDDPNYNKNENFIEKQFDFAVTNDANVDGQTIINYNVICEGMSQYESGIFTLILEALRSSDGKLNSLVKEKIPNADFVVLDLLYLPTPCFTIQFSNVNQNDKILIKEIVKESFKDLIDNGIKVDILDGIMNHTMLSLEAEKDSHGFSDFVATFFARAFSDKGNDILGYLKYYKSLNEIEDSYKKGEVQKLINKYLNNDNNSSMTITVPKAGLLEEKTKSLNEKLKSMKDKMSDDEINDLIAKTKKFDDWVYEESEKSIIGSLRVSSVSELEEYRASCSAYEETSEGIHFIRSNIENIKYHKFDLLFDISNLNVDDAMKLKFISLLLGELPTTNYANQKLKSEIYNNTHNYSSGIYVCEYYDGGYKPYFLYSITALDKCIDKNFELLDEVMYETKFDDLDLIRSTASKEYNDYRINANNNPISVAISEVDVKTNIDKTYSHRIGNIYYMNFLKAIIEMDDDTLIDYMKDCRSLLESVYNKNGLVCKIIGNFDTIKNIKNQISDLAAGFNRNKNKVASVSDISNDIKKSTAVVTSGLVQYNVAATSLKSNSIEYTSKYDVLTNIINDKILYPEFRVKNSVYGAYSSVDRNRMIVYTYRDPKLKQTYDILYDLPNLIKSLNISDDEIEDYKLNSYSKFSYPLTKFEAAEIAVNETFTKVSEKRAARYVRYQKEIKDFDKDDIYKLSKLYDNLVLDKIFVTAGSKEEIENNKNMFEEIIYDYIK